MKGKIVNFDPKKGSGKIATENRGIKPFTLAVWKDPTSKPAVGMEVDFDIENDEVINLYPESFFKIENLQQGISYKPPKDLTIKETIPLNDCLNDFFDRYIKISDKYKDALKAKHTIPYQKLKRFIFTAYNNLLELDQSVNDRKLMEAKYGVEELEYYFLSLAKEARNPLDVMLDKVFLNKQSMYRRQKKTLEVNKKIVTDSMSKAKSLEKQINNLQTELSNLKPGTPEYKAKEEELKACKKTYVDLIDRAQNLKDENAQLLEEINKFRNFYKDIFKEAFSLKIKILMAVLNKELDAMTYQFDVILWENAKKSKSIQKFFQDAKIEGNYSTKTFLKYYLKNLNTEKMNQKDNELLEILNELAALDKNVAIFDMRKERARRILMQIENIDHDANVNIFDDIKEFIMFVKEKLNILDLVIMEVNDNTKPLISKILVLLKKHNIEFLLYSEELDGFLSMGELFREIKEFF